MELVCVEIEVQNGNKKGCWLQSGARQGPVLIWVDRFYFLYWRSVYQGETMDGS